MATIGIVNFAERLLNHTSTEGQDSQIASKQVRQAGNEAQTQKVEDQFTPSRQNEGDAGLFQVSQFNFFSAAAEFLLTQTAPPAANQTAATLAAQANVTPAPQVAPAPAAAAPVKASQAAAPVVAPAAAPAAATSNISAPAQVVAPVTANANAPANTQSQLQRLNTALAALGLNPAQLEQVDLIASLIKDFNPTAFTSLVYQLEALAQANTPQPAPSPASTATGSAAPVANNGAVVAGGAAAAANTGTANGANATGSGFQIQELSIKFTGVQETLNQSGANGQAGNTSVQLSAFNLQIEEVNLTLTNSNGETAQIQAPQAWEALPPAQAKAAAS